MIYNWYPIILKTDFDALNIPSKEVSLYLQDIGLKTVLITKGNYYSFLYEDIFLTYNLNSRNPFNFDVYGIFLKDDMFYLGIKE